jgi:hypothetical protein
VSRIEKKKKPETTSTLENGNSKAPFFFDMKKNCEDVMIPDICMMPSKNKQQQQKTTNNNNRYQVTRYQVSLLLE